MNIPHVGGSLSPAEVDELTLSRVAGEPDEDFYAREVRQKCNRYLEASANLEVGKSHGNNSETMHKLDAAYRHARFMLKGAVDSLHETLTGK